MKNIQKHGHTKGVTQDRSHSDSGPKPSANPADMPFEILSCITVSLMTLGKPREIALSHTLLNPWCDRVTPSGVTRCDGSLASCVRTSFAWLEDEFPGVRHGMLVHGVRDRKGCDPRPPMASTLRQYASRMGATVMVLDMFPLSPADAVMILPAGRWQVAPKALWSSMAVQLLTADLPQSHVRANQL